MIEETKEYQVTCNICLHTQNIFLHTTNSARVLVTACFRCFNCGRITYSTGTLLDHSKENLVIKECISLEF
jgi:hypothetical protein